MNGEDIKKTITKIKADGKLIEKIKELEGNKPKRLVLRSEFWGSLAAACWVMVVVIFLFNMYNKNPNDITLSDATRTLSISPTNTVTLAPSKTPTHTNNATPTTVPTPSPSPVPTKEPYPKLNAKNTTFKIQLPEGITKREYIDMVGVNGGFYVSLYNDISKSYKLYNIDKASGNLSAISPELKELKLGNGLVVYKKNDAKYYTNSYKWDSEVILPENIDNLESVFIVSETNVVFLEYISGYTSYIRYIQYNVSTKVSSMIYEIKIHGNIIGGIPFPLLEPIYANSNISVLLNKQQEKIKILEFETKQAHSYQMDKSCGVAIFQDEIYIISSNDASVFKIDITSKDQHGRFNGTFIETIYPLEVMIAADKNSIFLLNINNQKGLFMFNVLTQEIYLVDNVDLGKENFVYAYDNQLFIFDDYEKESRTMTVTISSIE